ncbi:MAG: ferritin [Prevotella sp.]|nr:ferritin [Prevotella sp.]
MKISKKMQDAFNAQITAELYSSNLYLQMAFWFRKEGWKGFAAWMFDHSNEEKEHALKMADFVLNRGGEAVVTAIDAPTQDFKDPKDIFEQTLKHEEWVTEKINELADAADAEHDRASINFVDQFIDEQVEEEKTVRDILNLFRHRDGHTVATIDDIVGNVKEE